jgi:nitrate/nitrite-specific signal transduction histidine kinase
MVLVILSFLAAMEDRLSLAVELFGQLAAVLPVLLVQVETLERQIMVGVAVAEGPTEEQAEQTDLP